MEFDTVDTLNMNKPNKNNNTVFVIGAGASKEANLPTGEELKSQIIKSLNSSFDTNVQQGEHDVISKAIGLYALENDGGFGIMDPYLNEVRHIIKALPLASSIDNFLDTQKGNRKIQACGKLAIVRSILHAEKNSRLRATNDRFDSMLNFLDLTKTWYVPFFRVLTENCDIKNLKDRMSSVTLIIFNYDRCVEHFLYNALQIYYKITDNYAAEIVNEMKIFHPYGVVGSLPWLKRNNRIDFGIELNPGMLLQLSKEIKTFTEGTDPESSEIVEIRNKISSANKVVFLGFAFHKLNMALLRSELSEKLNKTRIRCFATTYHISKSDTEVIEEQINSLFPGRSVKLNMADVSCFEFFTEYWRSLSF